MKIFFKQHKIAVGITALVLAVAGSYIFFLATRNKALPEAYTISLQDVREEVSVTGRVRSADDVDLAFEKSGRVVSVPVKIGRYVAKGALLASLDSGEALASLREAEAKVASAEVELAEIKRGTRTEEVAISEAKVLQLKGSLEDARRTLVNAIRDMYTSSDDSIRGKTDQFFSNPRTASVQLSGFILADNQLKQDIEQERQALEGILTSWSASLPVSSDTSSLESSLATAEFNSARVASFLNKVSLAVNSASVSSSLSATTIDGWRSAVSTARSNVSADITTLALSREGVRSAITALSVSEREYDLKIAGATTEEVLSQQAVVDQVRASLLLARVQLAKTALRAPFDGVVTRIEVDPGEIIPANTSAISLISRARFEIEASVPEADIARVVQGAHATITLDAYGSDVLFDAVIASVDPAETLVDGVATYRAILQFSKQDERIRSGMTANIDIRGGERLQVVSVPQRAVIAKNGERFVRKIEGEKIVEVPVVLGLRGSNGLIEITKGLAVGDKIVVYQTTE